MRISRRSLFVALLLIALAPRAGAAAEGAYHFAVIGDNRSGDRIYTKLVAAVMQRQPAFVVNTGDLIPNPGVVSEWATFWKLSQPITVPYYLVVGNHDVDNAKSEQVWKDEVQLPGNELYYSFTHGRDLFVVLDSSLAGHSHLVDGEQFAWLAKTLDPARYEHQFVFVHEPLFLWKGASHYGDSLDKYPEARDKLHQLFVAKRVTAVFAGHEHTFQRMTKDGVPYIITGGAGAPLYSGYNHFIVVDVNGPRIALAVIDRDGTMRDEFLLNPEGGKTTRTP